MSENQNIKIVQNAYAFFGRGDIPSLLATLTADVEWTEPGEGLLPQAGVHRGPGGVKRFFEIVGETLEFSVFEPREFFAKDDRVIVLGRYQAKVKATGRPLHAEWAMAFTFRAGKIAAFREFTDTANAALAYGTLTAK